jgi:hypothetical protein
MPNPVLPSGPLSAAGASQAEQLPIVTRSAVERFFLRTFFVLIPAVYLGRAVLQYLDVQTMPPALLDFIKIASELAIMIALALSALHFGFLPHALHELFRSHALSARVASDVDVTEEAFLRQLDAQLNHRYRVLVGIFAALLVFGYYALRIGGFGQLYARGAMSLAYVDLLLYILPAVAYAYFLGIVIWKLSVVGSAFRSMPALFDVNVRFGHPDGVGGLLPVGVSCLYIVLIAIVPTALSAVILLAPFVAPSGVLPYVRANEVALFGFAPLVLCLSLAGCAVGLAPLFRFHAVMLAERPRLDEMRGRIAGRIVELRDRLAGGDGEESTAVPPERRITELAALERLYAVQEHVGTWPVSARVLAAIWAAIAFVGGQIVALWSLFIRSS